MCTLLEAHNDVRAEGNQERATTTQKIKIWKHSHGSPVTIFSLYAETSQKDEKEYQDTFCGEAEERYGDRSWGVLYDYVVDPAASQPERGDLWGVFTHRKNSPFGFSRSW